MISINSKFKYPVTYSVNKTGSDNLVSLNGTISLEQNRSSPSFSGLSRILSKKLFDKKEEIEDFMCRYPRSNGVIGTLPAAWIEKIPLENRSDSIKNIYSAFGEAALFLREYHEIPDSRLIPAASGVISKSLIQAGIIDKPVLLKDIGFGEYGNAYLFHVLGEDFVIKVFHRLGDPGWLGHGHVLEPSRALFWQKNVKKSQYIKSFFSDMKNGYLITRFIDRNCSANNNNFDEKLLGISTYDKLAYNQINGYYFDYGGQTIFNPFLAKNKTARWVMKKIRFSQDKCKLWDKLFNEVNKNDIYLGLVASLTELPHDKAKECFKKLCNQNINDQVRQYLICCLDLVPEDQRMKYLLKLIPKSNIQANKIIKFFDPHTPLKMPSECRTKSDEFLRLNEHTENLRRLAPRIITIDETVKRLAAHNFNMVSDKNILDFCSELIADNNEDIKYNLIRLNLEVYLNEHLGNKIFFENPKARRIFTFLNSGTVQSK